MSSMSICETLSILQSAPPAQHVRLPTAVAARTRNLLVDAVKAGVGHPGGGLAAAVVEGGVKGEARYRM